MAKRKSRKQSTKTGLGERMILIPALVFVLVAYFMKDFVGNSYKWIGSYIWLLIFLIALTLRLFYLGQFVLPLKWHESWYDGIRLISQFNFPYLSALLRLSLYRRKKKKEKDSEKATDILPSGFSRHNAGVLESHIAVVLTKGPEYSRAAGPGYVSLAKGEKPAQIFDLRNHVRKLPVTVRTRDGIVLETSVSVVFHIRRQVRPIEPELPYSYDSGAMFQIHYLDSFNSGQESVHWSERVVRQASNELVSELSRFNLDVLFQSDRSGALPIERIKRRLKQRLEKTFNNKGITIVSVGVGHFSLPEEVLAQRIKIWQADWQSRAKAEEAAGQAEAQRRIALARARAQIVIIERITESIEVMRKSTTTDLSDIVSLRMLQALEEAAEDEAVKVLMPKQAMETWQQVYTWLRDGDGPS